MSPISLYPMKTIVLFFILMSFLFLPIICTSVEKTDYYPLTKGITWVYEVTNFEADNEKFEQAVSIERPETYEGKLYHILRQKDKRGIIRSFVQKNEEGVFWKKIGARKALTPEATTIFTPDLPIMFFPLKKGKSWDWEGTLKIAWINKKIKMHCVILEDNEEVTVPAGMFHCVKIYIHQLRDNEVSEEYGWYAPDIGQIKYQTKRTLKILKSYKMK